VALVDTLEVTLEVTLAVTDEDTVELTLVEAVVVTLVVTDVETLVVAELVYTYNKLNCTTGCTGYTKYIRTRKGFSTRWDPHKNQRKQRTINIYTRERGKERMNTHGDRAHERPMITHKDDTHTHNHYPQKQGIDR
jgi:hypothetical protein